MICKKQCQNNAADKNRLFFLTLMLPTMQFNRVRNIWGRRVRTASFLILLSQNVTHGDVWVQHCQWVPMTSSRTPRGPDPPCDLQSGSEVSFRDFQEGTEPPGGHILDCSIFKTPSPPKFASKLQWLALLCRDTLHTVCFFGYHENSLIIICTTLLLYLWAI